jgi:outer membrane murein-binding lipoprotein Lpp
MTSRQHQNWINKGKPNSGLVRPLALLRDLLRRAGYTVFDFPNDAHLDAEPPEDHTFYSETNWPGGQELWWMHAIDIMPTHGGADLYALGQQIVAARNAGLAPFIKYINVPTDATLKKAVQHRWEPDHAQGSSSDTGHIHISATTGVTALDSDFNPLLLEVAEMAHTIDEVYDALTSIANGGQPGAGGHSAVPDWVKTMQGYGAKLDSALSALSTLDSKVAALSAKFDALATASSPVAGSDVAVTGTLHLGG